MKKQTMTCIRGRHLSVGAALFCALSWMACGSDSPGPSITGSSGSGGSGPGGTFGTGGNGTGGIGTGGVGTGGTGTGGGQSTMDGGPDASEDASSTTPDAQVDNADVVTDVLGGDSTTNPGIADGGVLNPAVVQMMRKVADWQLLTAGGMKDWVHGTLWTGIVATYKATKDEKYLTAVKNWAGAGWGLNGGNAARGDDQCAAQAFFDTYLLDPVPANMVMFTGAKGSFDALVANPPTGSTEWWWEDALFMVPPGFARLGAVTGDKKYFDTMNLLYWSSYNFLLNPQVGLLYRDHRGNDVSFWSRGNGWVIAGIARILEYLPQDDPKRPDFVNALKTISTVVAKVQGADGLWRSDLMNASRFPNPETSGTAFFTYGIAWGINNGILDKATYLPVAQKGWDGLLKYVDATGKLGYVQAVGGAPGPATLDSSLPYAIGGFLLAGAEMAKLLPP